MPGQGIIRPDKTYRTMELSLHLPPEGEFDIDLDAVMKKARDAGAETVMFYAQDHWGYAHFTSDVGVRHPHLKGDFFGEGVSLARKYGMSVIGLLQPPVQRSGGPFPPRLELGGRTRQAAAVAVGFTGAFRASTRPTASTP